MKNLLVRSILLIGFITAGCTSDDFEEAGICVTCVNTAGVTIEACSNGDGTITLRENGIETTTSNNDTETFRISQEASMSTCM